MTNYSFLGIKDKSGFTMIELIVVFTVIAILSVIGLAASVNYSRAQSLETATQDLRTVLNQARSYAQSQYKPFECSNAVLEKYTVELNKQSNEYGYTLLAVCGGTHVIVKNQLPKDVIFDLSNNAPTYFDFPILSGGVRSDGSSPWIIRLLSTDVSDGKYKIITINSTGSIK